MTGKFGIKEYDKGMKEVFKQVRELHGDAKVAIGIRGESALAKKETLKDNTAIEDIDAPTLVDIATWQEYGTEDDGGYIPERSFIRATVEKNRDRYNAALYKVAQQIVNPKVKLDIKIALGIVGELVKADIQRAIRKGIAPELSATTIAMRLKADNTSTTPLIVTGQLIGAISYEVRTGE